MDRAYLWIAVAACLLYANTIPNQLVFDDLTIINEQAAIRHPGDLGTIFGGLYWGEEQETVLYRPLTIWTLALNWGANRALGLPGEQPVGYHIVNVLLHAAVGCVLYRFLKELELGRRPSLIASLLFVAHPLHTEAVASIVNRAEVLAAAWGLLFLVLHLRERLPAAGALCLLLALWSKESGVAFLPLAFWIDVWRGGFKRRTAFARYGIYGLALVLWLVLWGSAARGTSQVTRMIDNPLIEASVGERIATALCVQLDYLRLESLPVGLSSDYSFNQIPIASFTSDPRAGLFLGLCIAALVGGWYVRRTHRVVFLSVVGYGVLFLATSNLLYPIGTIMGERLAYSPSIFFCLLAGYALGALRRRSRSWAIGLVGVIMASYALLTIDRNRTWADPDTFFRTQVESAPESAKAHFSVGKRYHFAGETEKALHHYRRAVEILPDYPDVWNNMGGLYKDRGDLETALRFFQQTLSFHPEHPLALYNLGQIRQSQGDLERAAEAYRTVIRVDSTYVDAYNNLGVLYAAAGRFAEAAALWERALEIDPRQEAVRENLESLRLLMRSPGGEVAP